MCPLDAPLGKIAGNAEVLAAVSARTTVFVQAGATHHQHRQVAGHQSGNTAADINDLAECLVPDDKVWGAGGRCAVLERGDLAVGPADSGFEYTQFDFGRSGNHRLRLVDEPDLTARRKYSECLHNASSFVFIKTLRTLSPGYPIRSAEASGSLSPVTFFQRSSSSSFAAASRNSGAAHLYTSKSFLM